MRDPARRGWSEPRTLLASALVLAMCASFLWPTAGTPPGFHRDEASIALNALTVARDGVDQDGNRLPLFFLSYGGFLSPVWPYLSAGMFAVVEPSNGALRSLGGITVLLGLLCVGWLAWRRTGRVWVGLVTVALGAATPWLYELGRTGLEMAIYPLAVALVLLAADYGLRQTHRPLLLRAGALALTLALLTYCYAGGRGLAPLALAAFAVTGRGRWRLAGLTTVLYAITLIPLAMRFGEVRTRYDQTSFVKDGMSAPEIAGTFLWNYLQDIDIPKLLVSGDDRGYIHTWGAGQLLLGVVLLAAVGAWAARREADGFWRWVLAVLVLAPVPAALTTDRLHAERLVPVAVLLLALAGRGLQELPALWRSGRLRRSALFAAALVTVLQVAWFAQNLSRHGHERTLLFDAAVAELLPDAFARPGPVYVDFDERYGQTHARWYAATHDIPADQVVILSDGGVPAPGSTIFGRLQECDFPCVRIAEGDGYWVAVVEAPE